MFDCHNHLQDPRLTPFLPQIIQSMREVGIKKCVVTGTSEADWEKVATLAAEHPDLVIPAFGLHPWKIADRSKNWLSTLENLLQKHPQALLGECGLDEWIDSPDRPAQAEVFRAQIELARRLRRPLAIHCLHAWGSLFDLLETTPLPPRSLFHSFGGSAESAQRLAPHDPWFSFSGYFLDPRKKKARAAFKTLPGNRILLETDAPDMTPPPELLTHPLGARSPGSASRSKSSAIRPAPTKPIPHSKSTSQNCPTPLNHPANLPSIQTAFLQQIRPDLSPELLAENARCFLNIN